jgi:predicted GNAT family N-acyltransferase
MSTSKHLLSISFLQRAEGGINGRNENIATHFLLRLIPSHTPIGNIRVWKDPTANVYYPGRLTLLKEYRQYKFGAELMRTVHDWVREDAKQLMPPVAEVEVYLDSRLYLKGFYAK